MIETPDGHGRLELASFTPRRAGAVCYFRGPEGIIVELAEQIG